MKLGFFAITTIWRQMRGKAPVVEIGSGHQPYPQSHVLVDKMPEDNSERPGQLQTGGRPLIVADIENLPFKDGAFAYAIAAHVIEHAADIERALAELERVGRAGYIETPSALFEAIDPHDYHRWVLLRDGQGLRIRRKDTATEFANAFFARFAAENAGYKLWRLANQDLTKTRYEWTGKIEYRLEEEPLHPDEYIAHCRQGWIAFIVSLGRRTRQILVRKIMGGLGWLRRKPDLEALLQCTRCRGPLKIEAERVVCPTCEGYYPRKGNQYHLAPERFQAFE